MEEFKVLFSKEEVEERIKELAKEIDKDYEGKELVAICVLKGAVYFYTDLLKNLKTPLRMDFLRAKSYNGTESTGNIELQMEISSNIEGEDVLIVEDIIDSGYTLDFLKKYLASKNPRSIKIVTLLDKRERRKIDVKIDYNGFVIPNKFVVGYGFDIDEKYRNLPYIGYVEV